MKLVKNDLLNHKTKIAVWGVGNIGFLTLANYAYHGVKCIGVDVKNKIIKKINKGEVPIEHLKQWIDFDIKKIYKKNIIKATSDYRYLKNEKIAAHFISVPTENDGNPNYYYLKTVIKQIAEIIINSFNNRPLIIIESTLSPGTSDKIVLPLLRKLGLSVDNDLYYGVAPRRDWFVSKTKNLRTIPRVFGGYNIDATTQIESILSIVCDRLVRATDYRQSEIVKSIENAYRQVDITLANQLTVAYPNLNIREVLKLAGTKWNMQIFKPSFGIGGYCIPLASKYVLLGTPYNKGLTILDATVTFQNEIPRLIVEKLIRIGAKRVGILGLSYLKGVAISTLSPTLSFVELLKERSVEVKINDPFFSDSQISLKTRVGSFSFPNELNEFDAILIVTNHKVYSSTSPNIIIRNLTNCKFILDNHGVWEKINFTKLGITYHVAGSEGWLE